MQEYQKRSKNGDAGEYFAAYKFTKLFGWPYRMLDVDMGVDAEVEILDSNGISTSDLVKLQIKTFDRITSEESKKIYVSPEHIGYWKKFCLPIVLVCVDLENEKIYWKPVTATESYASGGESKVISINIKTDELTATSKSEFLTLVTPEESKNIEMLLNKARQQHTDLLNQSTYAVDGEQLNNIEKKYYEINATLSQVDDIVRHFPWRAGLLTLKEISIMRRNAQITLNDASHSYAVGVNGM